MQGIHTQVTTHFHLIALLKKVMLLLARQAHLLVVHILGLSDTTPVVAKKMDSIVEVIVTAPMNHYLPLRA